MNHEELEAVYRRCRALIIRKSLLAGGKAATFGSEGFEKLIDAIGDAYGLTEDERELLDPELAKMALSAIGQAVPMARNTQAVRRTYDTVMVASKNSKLIDTIGAFASGGAKAANAAAKGTKAAMNGTKAATSSVAKVASSSASQAAVKTGGKAASKAGWIGIAICASVGAATGATFFWRARNYSLACYQHIREKHGLTEGP